ncbi:Calponin homology domain-containing proteinorein N [Phytophthora infestans]|uniref:Calponin homology domain-containing proteinorein N n=1 Tax=Phytophthora infestans TaxID=4787 RepID=A0A833W153_PHYIN|nr:Calponin homology domain-containing proteinorein N [Phytophthora infestans]
MIFEVLQQVLNEFFVDVQEDNVSFYAGDLFEPSHFKLSDVFLQTSVINSLQLPFELSAGYLGNVTVEGLVGAVAGWPLEVSVSDLCLVLKPRKVQWENELLIRYARELLVAICQCLGRPAAVKKDSASFISPAKWIWSRIKAVGADMTVQLERIHIRVESPRSDNLVAYGLYIPLIRFAPREVEEQILYRRQQPGVLLTIENVSFYTDLDSSTYWTAAKETAEHPIAVLLTSQEPITSSNQRTLEEVLKRFKECALRPFRRAKQRELAFIRVLWIKLDFKRAPQNPSDSKSPVRPVLTAVDIATEEIEVKVDFDQVAMTLEELEHVVDYFKRARTWHWRPSCIDREHHAPPSVQLSAIALLPLPLSDEERASLVFSIDKQRKSRLWFRAMWRYAFRCIVDQKLKSRREETDEETDAAIWWRFNDIVDKELQQVRRQRYMHLYARSLSPDAMEIALYGRGKALLSLYSQDPANKPPASPRRRPLPVFDPLTQEEQWELSDFVTTMSVYEQRVCRALAEQELRRDYTAAPPSPTRKVSSSMEFSVAPTDSTSHHGRSYSVDSIASTSPHRPASPDATVSRHKRGLTLALTPGELSVRLASSPTIRPHSASTSDLPSPTKHESALDLEPLRAWIFKQRQLGLHTTSWFEKQFFHTWVLNPSKVIPLLNWHIGPVRVRLTAGDADHVQVTKRDIGVEIGIEGCSGAMLLSRVPFLRMLVEFRVGLLHVTLMRKPQLDTDVDSGDLYKWISSGYIRSPEDGFFYVGLKYSAHEVAAEPNGRVQFVGNPEEELGLKGRMCVGPIKIDCNEAAIRAAMGQNVADELQTSNTDVASATHFSVLQDAYHNFVRLVVHLPKRKGSRKRNPKDTSPRAKKRPGVSNVTDPVPPDQQKLERSARRTRMFHALLLRSSTFEVEVGTLEVNLSTYTSHIEKALRGQVPRRFEAIKPSETREEVNVKLPSMICRLQNRPAMNECVVDAAGARVIYRSTEQGRAAVIRHLAQLFKL